MDIEARQLALQYLDRAKRADTIGKQALEAARKLNMEVALKPTDAKLARRAVLARDAYNARMSAEAGRTAAAYALIAEKEGTRAITAQQAMAKVEQAKRGVLAEEVKGGQLRRNIMLQAAQAAEKALKSAPGLPATIVGKQTKSVGAGQVTANAESGVYRPERYGAAMNAFFPEDVRAAASSFRGLSGLAEPTGASWFKCLGDAIEKDAAVVLESAKKQAEEFASQEPGAAGLAQQANGLIAQLRRQYMAEMPTGQHPWLHMAGSALAVFIILKVLK